MNLLIHVHAFPPTHWAGAETMAFEMAQQMIKRGHSIRVISKKTRTTQYHGIKLMENPAFMTDSGQRGEWYNWADLVWTHLGMAGEAMNLSRRYLKPLLHIVHNNAKITPSNNVHVKQGFIFNSHWLKELHLKDYEYTLPYTVCRPTIDPTRYQTRPGDAITLINLNENKGGYIFMELAKRMEHLKFIGVQGMYGWQIVQKGPEGMEGHRKYYEPNKYQSDTEYVPCEVPKNFEFVENTDNIRGVYARTGILLIPSKYESFGRTASEAMCSGIPVIYSDTPGLREHVGEGGLMVKDRDNLDQWEGAIREVLSDWEGYSEKAKARFDAIGDDFDELEAFCKRFIK